MFLFYDWAKICSPLSSQLQRETAKPNLQELSNNFQRTVNAKKAPNAQQGALTRSRRMLGKAFGTPRLPGRIKLRKRKQGNLQRQPAAPSAQAGPMRARELRSKRGKNVRFAFGHDQLVAGRGVFQACQATIEIRNRKVLELCKPSTEVVDSGVGRRCALRERGQLDRIKETIMICNRERCREKRCSVSVD